MAASEHEAEHASQRRRSALLRREWQLSLYPQAAEAGGCLVTMRSGESAGRGADPERAATEAVRSARAKIRRLGHARGSAQGSREPHPREHPSEAPGAPFAHVLQRRAASTRDQW